MLSLLLVCVFMVLLMRIPFLFLRGGRACGHRSHLATLLAKEFAMGLWHRVFGPPYVRIYKRRRRKRHSRRRWR